LWERSTQQNTHYERWFNGFKKRIFKGFMYMMTKEIYSVKTMKVSFHPMNL